MKSILIPLIILMLCTALPAGAAVFSQNPPDTDGIDTDGDGIVDNDHIYLHMSAGDGFVNMADGRLMYMFGFGNATGIPDGMVMMEQMLGSEFPAPTIKVREGQKLYLNLTNVGMMLRPDLFDPHSVHWHGFPNAAPFFDGVPDASITINMMSTFTYFYNIIEPGTFMWHCHVEATEHMQMGMLGNLYVLPKQDMSAPATSLSGFIHEKGFKYTYNDEDGSTYYDVDFPIQLSAFDPDFHDASLNVQPLPFALMEDKYSMINGRGYPDTINPAVLWNTASDEGLMDRPSQPVNSLITAKQGEKILLRFSSLVTTHYYTVTVLGIPMKVIGTGARPLISPSGEHLFYDTASITLGGGEAKDIILDTSAVEPGTYFLYTTNMNYLSNNEEDFGGMMTEIVIDDPYPLQILSLIYNEDGSATLTCYEQPGKTVNIEWADGYTPTPSWNQVDNPALDRVHHGDGTWSWTDFGTDPEMLGLKPGDVLSRSYRVVVQ
ncbi:MAG: multicopper oxidase domain-containing protein [Acidobacteria bacterium]|nr:multicopper oxidase domain-containing protein [Acidobacteriota bacterium]